MGSHFRLEAVRKMKTEKCSRKNHQFRVHKIDDSFCDPKALVFGFQSCSARDGLRLIIMRIRFRASDCGLVDGENMLKTWFSFLLFGMYFTPSKAFSYGTFLRTENERFQFSKPIVSLMGSKMVHFRVKFFDFHFRDGLHSEMEPHFRSTS